ncbi:MAG: hypothetical protein KME27_18685 [Lyngbya sp. HA4199-MV5]|nr:hypothetical protein [Lyngbya sp. HA4199-MV5]
MKALNDDSFQLQVCEDVTQSDRIGFMKALQAELTLPSARHARLIAGRPSEHAKKVV